jgi:hypothetical protein
MTHTQRTHLAHAPDSEDREVVQEATGMTDPAEADRADDGEGGSGTAGPKTAEKDQAGSYARDAEQDPEGERHDRADSDR